MSAVKRWDVHITISEDGPQTLADATLDWQEQTRLHGVGRARCNPADTNIPEIGEELATARALSDLAHQLLHVAADDIEASTHQPAHLRA